MNISPAMGTKDRSRRKMLQLDPLPFGLWGAFMVTEDTMDILQVAILGAMWRPAIIGKRK